MVDSTRSNPEVARAPASRHRVASIDIYRGMVMFLMLAEVLSLPKLTKVLDSDSWVGKLAAWIAFHTSHVSWAGGSLHDMIQPGFSFLVGAAMAFSLVARTNRGDSFGSMFRHAILRSIILIVLGIVLRSLNSSRTNFTFDDTLTQIGLGYWALFLVAQLNTRAIILFLAVLLVTTWIAFVAYPAPGSDFPYASNGVPDSWQEFYTTGFASHFNKNSNLAWAFDRWWMNLFPREKPFEFSSGGYQTLNFIPTLGTMILGLLAGRVLQTGRTPLRTLQILILSGVGLMSAAYALDWLHICPIVKRIWTPAWTLWSGGISMLWLGGLYWIADVQGWARWAFPFVVVGANSIVAYVMSWTIEQPVVNLLQRHFGWFIDWFGRTLQKVTGASNEMVPAIQQLTVGALTLLIFWLILYWLYKNRVFIRI